MNPYRHTCATEEDPESCLGCGWQAIDAATEDVLSTLETTTAAPNFAALRQWLTLVPEVASNMATVFDDLAHLHEKLEAWDTAWGDDVALPTPPCWHGIMAAIDAIATALSILENSAAAADVDELEAAWKSAHGTRDPA